jgi:hypothetical protein
MRILEQTKDVLTLQNPAKDFWFGMIVLLLSGPPVVVLLAMIGGWLGFLSLFVAGGFCLALKQMWASDVVKICSFNKAFGKITVRYHGVQTKIKELSLQYVQTVEVKHTTGFAYGCRFERYQLWLVTKEFKGAISLSEEVNTKASLETFASQVREFLMLNNC